MTAPLPDNEIDRLNNLRAYHLLDSLPEQEFDDLTALASHVCGTPISLISLVDEHRQWFKSSVGVEAGVTETDRDLAFCAHTILDPTRPLVVKNPAADPRFRDNALVTEGMKIGFYAGVPLVTREGHALGSICVLDRRERELSPAQLGALQQLARQTIKLFELRRALADAEEDRRRRESAYLLLRNFSHVIAHDLKAPIRNIRQATELIREDTETAFSDDATQLLQMVEARAVDASRMIDGVLRYAKSTNAPRDSYRTVKIAASIDHVVTRLNPADCRVDYVGSVERLSTSQVLFEQIMQNLIGNAVKFNDKAACHVEIDCCKQPEGELVFTVSDNGPGIPPNQRTAVFRLFHTAAPERQLEGHGVGLSIVEHLLRELGGSIRLDDVPDRGARFIFTLPQH